MKIKTVREVRGAIPRDPPMRMITSDGVLLLEQGGHTSVLRGPLARWVESHLDTISVVEGTSAPTNGGLSVTTPDGAVVFSGWPESAAPAVTPLPTPPPPEVPAPDLPPTPQTIDDWRQVVDRAAIVPPAPISPILPGETVADYSARVLAPMGLTLAAVIRNGAIQGAFPESFLPEWEPIHALVIALFPPAPPPV